MARTEDAKRREICSVAARLFATRAFHEVRIDDVAAEARISKGSVYTYFESKEALYLALVREGAADLVDRLERGVDPTRSAIADLRVIVEEITAFAVKHPDVFKLAHQGKVPPPEQDTCGSDGVEPPGIRLLAMLETVIRRGVERGELQDRHPAWTAQFVRGVIVDVMTHATGPVDGTDLAAHVMDVFLAGLQPRR